VTAFCETCQGAHDVGDDRACRVLRLKNASPLLYFDPLADLLEEAAILAEAEHIVRRAP
jgi:hypothetical protein